MKNNSILFFTLYALIFAGTVFSQELLGTEQLLYSSLAEQLTVEQLQEVIRMRDLWSWVGYLILPLLLYLKILLIATTLSIGTFLFEQNIKFNQLFNIVVKAEFIFLLPMVFKATWFYFFKTDYTLAELQNFMPLSLQSLFGHENFESWFLYPLQTANLFEVAYWFALAFLLAKALQITKSKAFTVVASSYGVGLIIWVATVSFIVLNLS
ncbi:MAG: hypothetical protein LBI15_08790 [Dysgonamonadaceae bacterium]|jgi:hypothetical protein|nr:hypothetical protein [Dysgonamonadaceae bacterium]